MFDNGKSGFGFPKIEKAHTLVLTTSKYRYNECISKGIPVMSLSAYLGISPKTSIETLFGVYNHFFTPDFVNMYEADKIGVDTVLINTIYDAFLKKVDFTTYCLNIGNTFCWFNMKNNKVLYEGHEVLTEPASMYSVGKFANRLRYLMVQSGASLNNVVFYSWGDFLLEEIFPNYKDLRAVMSGIKGLGGLSLEDTYEQLSEYILTDKDREEIDAHKFVNLLIDNASILGMHSDSYGNLLFKQNYYKNYSACKSNVTITRDTEFFMIVDCEGVSSSNGALQNGFREIGVILCIKQKDRLVCRYFMQSQSAIFESFMKELPCAYRAFSGRNIPKNGIKTYVYGASDKKMIQGQIETIKDRWLRNKSMNLFDFVDVKYLIGKVLDKDGMTAKRTLQNIARHFNVMAVRPKHNALSDARTLFNILSAIKRRENLDEAKEI